MSDNKMDLSTVSDLQERLAIGLSKGLEAARRDLKALRRDDLDALEGALSLELSGKALRLSKQPVTWVRTVQFPNYWEMERLEQEIVQCTRAWVIASSRLSDEVMFIVASDGNRLKLGFTSSSGDGSQDESGTVLSRLHASFPGVSFESRELNQEQKLKDALGCYAATRLLTGIPAVMVNDGQQLYSLDRLVRGMRGRPFALTVVARRMEASAVRQKHEAMLSARSENWQRIQRELSDTVGEEQAKTIGLSGGVMGGFASAVTKAITSAASGGGLGTLSFMGAPMGVGTIVTMGGNAAKSTAETISNTLGKMGGGQLGANYSITNSRSRSTSSSHEELNAFAEAYDALLSDHAERYASAMNEGAWEAAAFVFGKTAEDAALASSIWTREMGGNFEPVEPFRTFDARRDSQAVDLLSLPRESRDRTDLYTVFTSSELAAMMNLPVESHPGIEVRRVPRFAMNFPLFKNDSRIGLGQVMDREVVLEGIDFDLPVGNLASHGLVAGITGSGKTTTVKSILNQLGETPFIVIEPAKTEYRDLLGRYSDLRVYTAGSERVSPFRLNPFELPEDGNLMGHIDALSSIINAAFPMEGPMASLVEQAAMAAYETKGWDVGLGYHPLLEGNVRVSSVVPTMSDFYQALERLIGEQGYAGDYGANIRAALLTRIRSLCIGPRGKMFNTRHSVDIADMVRQPVVIELKELGNDETKNFMMGLLLQRIYKYFEYSANNQADAGELRCLLVVEEAHRLFRKSAGENHSITGTNTRHHSVELFENIMAEARAFGLGIVVVDQLPLRLSEGAVKNTGTKIIHRLSAVEDATEMGGSMGLSPDEATYITRLRRGEALVYRSDMEVPAHIAINADIPPASSRPEDDKLSTYAAERGYSLRRRGPLETDRVVESLRSGCQHEFISLADAVVFSLLFGRLEKESLMLLVGRAEDRVFELGRTINRALSEETAGAVLVEMAEEVIKAKLSLRRNPLLLDKALACWQQVVAPTWASRKLSFDSDAVLKLRAVLEEACESVRIMDTCGLVGDKYKPVVRFLAESRGDASSLAARIGLGPKHGGPVSVFETVVDQTVCDIDQKLLAKGGQRLCEYALAMVVQAHCMLGGKNPGDDEVSVAWGRLRKQWDKNERRSGNGA